MEYVNICIRTTLFYFFILLIYRIMGKREVGQLGIIDLIVSILIAELAVLSIEEIEDAILENNGTLSVFAYEEEKDNYLPLPLILDNKIQEDTLKHLHKDSKWVLNLLNKRNINIEDVFYAFYKDKNVFIIKNDDLI